MFYTYILLSKKDKKFYTGYTKDLKKRIDEHMLGKVVSTKYRRPLNLIYYEACMDENDARQRENYLKSGRGKRYVNQRLKEFLFRSGFGQ